MTDYIDRQAAIDAIKKLHLPRTKGERPSEGINRFVWSCAIDCAEEKIGHLPSIEPVKHGRWIVVSDGYGNGDATAHICECSECKDTIWVYKKATRRWNYCPNCGAKMDLGGEAHEQN